MAPNSLADLQANNLAVLQALTPADLTPVVREATGDVDALPAGFTVRVLSDKGVMSPGGLFVVSGSTTRGREWSAAVKVFKKQQPEQDPGAMWFWRREPEAYQSGLLSALPGPVRAPRFYGLDDREDRLWLWTEHVVETAPSTWTLDEYGLAARELGRFNAACLTGTPLPEYQWLLKDFTRQWSLALGVERGEKLHPWENDLVLSAFPASARERIAGLAAERESFYSVMRELPQVFAHGDYHRRNLLIRDGQVVAVDWALCGPMPVGGELHALVGASCFMREWDARRIRELEDVTFEAYLAGLRERGWEGDWRLVRLGYAVSLGLHFGMTADTLTVLWCAPERAEFATHLFGGTPQEVAESWALLGVHALDLIDEARELLAELRWPLAVGA
ncbi:MAG TPA: phosphotransferase [Deinococcales bacterium]|nr:phosphotransferase [Deinococcales bacterium]